MNSMPYENPYAPALPPRSATHQRDTALRRWQSQRKQEQQQARQQAFNIDSDRLERLRALRPGRALANQFSPVYSMFNESLFRAR